MAITIHSQPPLHTGAFGKNIHQLSTSNGDIKQLRYELLATDGSTLLGTQFSPLFNYPIGRRSIINTGGLYSSLFPSYTNPILGFTNMFHEINPTNHFRQVINRFTEVNGTSISSTSINLYKAVNVNFNVAGFWNTSGTEKFLAYTRLNNRIRRFAVDGQYIPIVYYTNQLTTDTLFHAGTVNKLMGFTSINLHHYRSLIWRATSTLPFGTIRLASNTLTYPSLELSIDRNLYSRSKILYFLNDFGGWEWYNFIDYESVNRGDKTQILRHINIDGDLGIGQLSNDSVRRFKLFGRPATRDFTFHLKDLVTSPIVLDENGIEVRVLDDNIMYDGLGLIEPTVTIEYIREKTIKF